MKWIQNLKLFPSQWFFVLTLMVVINFCIKDMNPIFVLVLLPFGLLWFYEHWKWYQIMEIALLALSFGFITGFIRLNWNLKSVNYLLFTTGFYDLRMQLINYIGLHYDLTDASFLRLLLLNYHDEYAKFISQNINNLSVGFLFVVSGFHINLLLFVIKWIFKRKLVWIFWILAFIIVLSYGYFLGFTIGILRILLNMLIQVLFGKYFSSFSTTALSGIILSFILFKENLSYGFLMTYYCSLLIIFLVNLKLKKWILTFLINFLCIVLTLPLVLMMSHKINVFALFLNYIYIFMIPVFFFWFIFFFAVSGMTSINHELIKFLLWTIQVNVSLAEYIEVKQFSVYWVSFYYFACNLGLICIQIKKISKK